MQVAPVRPQAHTSPTQAPLQHSEFELQPEARRQHPPSKQFCFAAQSAFELHAWTGGEQKPPWATPVQHAAAEFVGPLPVMQQVPPSQAEPAQQASEAQEAPAAAQIAPVEPLLLLARVDEPPVVETLVPLPPDEALPELAFPVEPPLSEVLVAPLEDARVEPWVVLLLLKVGWPLLEQELTTRPIAAELPRTARQNSRERLDRSPRSPCVMDFSPPPVRRCREPSMNPEHCLHPQGLHSASTDPAGLGFSALPIQLNAQ